MGLPRLDFRVPETSWFQAVMTRVNFGAGRSSAGALAWPYKIAVVAVMALVACGTLVTFGLAGAETSASASDPTALPGTDEASPLVQGQVMPPTQSLLSSQDLLSTLNLTDFSPTTDSSDSDAKSDDNSDSDKDSKSAKAATKAAAATSTATSSAPASSTPGSAPTSAAPTTAAPNPQPTSAPPPSPTPSPVEGSSHKNWKNCVSNLNGLSMQGICGSEPSFTS